MSGTEQNKLDKLNARYKRQNDKIQKNYDRVSAVLPKGSTDRIKALGISTNQFINSAVSSELDKLESGKTPKRKPKEPTPDKVNGKPVYRFWEEDEYIKRGGQWWHEVVFFHDDMELNDLFIKFLDISAKENENYKDGCRLWFDLINLQREVGKISDLELLKMTDEEIDKIPDELLEETIDQNEELKALLNDCVYNGNDKSLLEFIGFYELAEMTKDNK